MLVAAVVVVVVLLQAGRHGHASLTASSSSWAATSTNTRGTFHRGGGDGLPGISNDVTPLVYGGNDHDSMSRDTHCVDDAAEIAGIQVIMTAPAAYADRLRRPLEEAGAIVTGCPTIVTDLFSADNEYDEDDAKDRAYLKDVIETCHDDNYDYIAYTSRRGIQATIEVGGQPFIDRFRCDDNNWHRPASSSSAAAAAAASPPSRPLRAIALGVDAQALIAAGIPPTRILVPDTPTPTGIVDLLRDLHYQVDDDDGRQIDSITTSTIRVLCPVPKVTGGLTEPRVVPDFLDALSQLRGCQVTRVDAYKTRWVGPSNHVAQTIRRLLLQPSDDENTNKAEQEGIIVICVSSTSEVEGLLLLCRHYGIDWQRDVDHRRVLIASHGPVTARGAQALLGGAANAVTAISTDSSSFRGMVGAVRKCVTLASS